MLQRICSKKVICALKIFMILSLIVVKNKIWNWVKLKLTFLEILMKKFRKFNKYLKEDINQKQLKLDTLILKVWIYKLIISKLFVHISSFWTWAIQPSLAVRESSKFSSKETKLINKSKIMSRNIVVRSDNMYTPYK